MIDFQDTSQINFKIRSHKIWILNDVTKHYDSGALLYTFISFSKLMRILIEKSNFCLKINRHRQSFCSEITTVNQSEYTVTPKN